MLQIILKYVNNHNFFRHRGVDKINEPFSIRLQQFHHIASIRHLLSENCLRELRHEPTAIIFQPARDVCFYDIN